MVSGIIKNELILVAICTYVFGSPKKSAPIRIFW